MLKLISIVLIALICYSLPFLFSDELISPDDLIYDHFSTHLARTGKLAYRPPGDATFGWEGFTPRYFVYSQKDDRKGETLPRKFPGFIFFWAVLKRLLPPLGARFVNPLCGILALIFLFFIGRIVLPTLKESLWAVVLLATMPVFVHRTYAYNPTLFNLTFFLASLYFLLSALQQGSFLYYFFFGLFAGGFLWIRPTNAVYLLSFLILIFLERRRVKGNFLVISVFLIVILGAGLLFYNYSFYGSFFNLGYTVTYQPPETALGSKIPLSIRRIVGYLSFHPKIWLLHLKNSPLSLSLAFPILILSLIGFFAPREEGEKIRFRLFYFWLFILSLFFFSNFETYGHEKGELTLHSSFLRYLMPTLSLLPLFAARLVSRVTFSHRRFMTILIIFNLVVALLAPSGAIETIMQSKYYGSCHRFLLAETHPDAVLFSHYWEKLAFPELMVYTNGTQFPGDDVDQAIEKVARQGNQVVTTSHPYDKTILKILKANYQTDEIVGPKSPSLIIRLAARFIPEDLYPLRIYRVVSRRTKASEESYEKDKPAVDDPSRHAPEESTALDDAPP